MTGGVLAIIATVGSPRFDPLRRVPCHYHGRPDLYVLMLWNQTAGMALKWFRDEFFGVEAAAAREADRDPYDDMMAVAARAPAGCNGLVMLPHLEGAACPEFNPAAKGVFCGVTLRHGRPHFIRSILEAVAYMLRQDVELVQELGVPVQEVRSIGGGARSPLWLQIKADVLRRPVATLACEEVACLGAAMLAATAAGHFTDLQEAATAMVRVGAEPSSRRLTTPRSMRRATTATWSFMSVWRRCSSKLLSSTTTPARKQSLAGVIVRPYSS